MKACKICGVTKLLRDFYKDRSMTDGTRNICKDCKRVARKPQVYKKRKRTKTLNDQLMFQKLWVN